MENTVSKWISFIGKHRYPVHAVRSWVVNLMSDLELKYSGDHANACGNR
ncbi:hypothetical protein [Paenibacillus hamazuiensis]|nr:hypothetical protein [Paenibacillus hamazuiensis]